MEALRKIAAALAELNGQKEGVSQRWQMLKGKLAGDPGFQPAQRLQGEARRLEADAARPRCELIEVADEGWQNAVEGCLNRQRFDLFVPPEAFDAALAVYEQRKREFRLHSVGLVISAAAREAAGQEFKEHFIYKLQEYIVTARDPFRHLNSVLERIPFGQDRYSFAVGAGPSHKALCDMIMDPLAVEGPSLFAGAFREKYRGTLDQLLAAILDPDGEQQSPNIEEFTDYRTYLDFDSRIHHAGGKSTLFSRVLREKSGGETRTPFYVAMVASFLQLYGRDNAESARLMLFDEAFNRMDPDRAEHNLQFIRQLGLQVLAAAPTDRCEIIAPHVETTLLVMRSGDQLWVEDDHRVLADDPLAKAEAAATGEQP